MVPTSGATATAASSSANPDADASSLSEISAISTSSLCSPKNANSRSEESSVLILETSELGGLVTRHYLIPSHLNKSGRGKLRRKGVKLHVVAEHIFVAKHFKR